jgi:hypothetical protein
MLSEPEPKLSQECSMRPIAFRAWASVVVMAGCLAIGTAPARGQMGGGMGGAGRSLGGYGASTISSYYGGGGGGYLPYNGQAGGFVPYRGSAIGSMSTQPIPRRLPQTPIGGVTMPETPIGGSSLSGGMGGSQGRGGAMGARPEGRTLVPFGYEGGVGMGSGLVGTPMTRPSGTRRPTPGPGFGYPFRVPPSLSGPSSSMGMQ